MGMKKYWFEIVIFAIIGFILVLDTPDGITWMNTDSDGAHYILAAKYLTTAHHMSAPLYLLLGHLFLYLPFGTEAWRMGLLSVVGTMGCAVFIYLIVRHLLAEKSGAKWYAVISVLVFGGSALVISQSTIIETYTLSMMCGVGGYYFALKKRWAWASVIVGCGLAVHPFLAFIAWAVLFIAFKEMRHWKRFGVTILFFLFYLYIPIVAQVNPNNDMWGNETASGLFGGTLGMVLMHTGGIAIWDLPKRIIDDLFILVVSFGLGIVPLVWYFIKQRTWKSALLWLVLIPFVYVITDLAQQVVVYLIVGVAFGSIAVGLGLSKLNIRWAWAVGLVAIGLLGFNANYFDIGRTLDPEMSAVKFYNDLDRIPDGEYFMGGGWTWSMVYLYNREEGRDIIPVSIDALPDKTYGSVLDRMGIKYDKMLLPLDSNYSYISIQGKIAKSIAEMNEGVWIAKETKPEVYQYVIEPAKGNEAYIGRWIGQEIEAGNWKWKPSNPWSYVSGALEVKEWHHILWANRNAQMQRILPLLFIGGMFVYLLMIVVRNMRRNEKR
jgi:hypothetical protein